jgi:hypothetical protein
MKNTKAWRNLSNGAHPFTTATELLVAASEYFQWCDDHPLLEEDVAVYQGDVTRYDRSKVRPYTLRGLGIYLNVSFVRLERYRVDNADFGAAMELIDQVIYTQKFEHAAAGLMNASIIKSDLGLTDKQELTGANGGAIKTLELTTEAHILDEARRLGIDVTALGFGVGKA